MNSLIMQNDSEVPIASEGGESHTIGNVSASFLLFKLCGTVGLKRRNSRETEPCLLPTSAGWAPVSSCPEPWEQAVDAPVAPGSPQAGWESTALASKCRPPFPASFLLTGWHQTGHQTQVASMLTEFERCLRIWKDNVFESWYLANCKALLRVDCNTL